MMQVTNFFLNRISPKTVLYAPTFKAKESTENKYQDSRVLSTYMETTAVYNSAVVKKVAKSEPVVVTPYKNNLRTMIQNNESVMLAIIPRTFTAEDLDGDEKITITKGEKPGTFLSNIERLDEIKELGINTLHILPIHPPGFKNAMGTAGSLYSPARYLSQLDDSKL